MSNLSLKISGVSNSDLGTSNVMLDVDIQNIRKMYNCGKQLSKPNTNVFQAYFNKSLSHQVQHHLHLAHLHHQAMDAPMPVGKVTTTAMMKTTPLAAIGMVVIVAVTMSTQPIAALVNAWIHLNKVNSKMH